MCLTAWWDPPRGRNSCWYFGGCRRGWQSKEAVVGFENGYNACKISWGSQAKMVSKCNRIASLVILNYKIFLGEVPQTPLTTGGQPPLSSSPPRTVGTRWTCLMAVPLSKSRRRPWLWCYTICTALLSEVRFRVAWCYGVKSALVG